MIPLDLKAINPRLLAPLVALFAVAVGVAVTAGQAKAAALATVGVIVVAAGCLIVARPLLATGLLLAVNLSGASTVVGYRAGLSVYFVSLALAVTAVTLAVAKKRMTLRWSPILLLPAVWLACQVPSVVVATDTAAAFGAFVEHAKTCVLFFTVLLVAVSTKRAALLLQVSVLVVAALATLTLVNEFVFHDATNMFGFSNVPKTADVGGATARHSGPEADANFWGRTLVLFLPIAVGLYAGGSRILESTRKVASPRWWLFAASAMLGGIYLTGSRGALIAAVLAVVLWLALAGQPYRTMLFVTPVLVIGLAFLPGVGSRIGTLTDLGNAANGQGDPSLVNRAAAQEIGLAMVKDNPVFGVGADNFDDAWAEYTTASKSSTLQQIAPHNLYLQITAETGLVGLAGWLVLYAGLALLVFRAYLTVSGPRPPPQHRAVLAGLFAALTGWAVASVVLHASDERGLFGVLALVGAFVLQERRKSEDAAVTLPSFVKSRRRLVDLAGVGAAVVVFACGSLLVGLKTTSYTTDVAIPLQITSETNGAYYYDLLNRQAIVPTYTSLLTSESVKARAADRNGIGNAARDAATVQVHGDDKSLLLHLEVSSSQRSVAHDLATRIATDTRNQLQNSSTVHRLGAPVAVSEPKPVSSVDTSRLSGIAIAAAVAGLATAGALHQRRPRRARG